MKRTNLEDFIKGKLAKGSFPYQEGAWEQAEAQFAAWDAARKRKRRWLILLLPFFVGVGILSWQLLSPGSATSVISPEAHTSILPTTIPSPSQVNTFHPSASNTTKFPQTQTKTQTSTQTKQKTQSNLQTQPNTLSQTQTPLQPNPLSQTQTQTQTHILPALSSIAIEADYPLPDSRISLHSSSLSKTPFKRLTGYIEAGTSLFQGFSNETITDPQWAVSPLVGAGIIYRLNRSLRLRTGLQYASRTQLNHTLKGTELNFGFVQQRTESNWVPQKLHYLSMPLELQVRVLPKHRMLVGGQFSWLMGTSGDMVTQRSNFYEPNQTPVTQKAESYVTGVSLWDMSAHLGYEVRLLPRWGLAGRYHFGLRDVMDDETFQVTGTHRNTRFTLLLNYQF